MVKYEVIDEIISNVLTDNKYFEYKCLSKAKITERLNSMSSEEKMDKMIEIYQDGLLSDYEVEFYEEWSDKWEKVKNKDFSKFPPHIQKEMEGLGEAIYNIESKIFTKKKNELSDFNSDNFKGDNMPYNSKENGSTEQKQIEYQDDKLKDIDWDFYGDGCNFYGDKYYDINKTLLEGDGYWNGLKKEMGYSQNRIDELKDNTRQVINHLNYLMDNSGGLQEDTVLYRGGAFPHDLVPGMKGKFETFSSTSYNREKAEGYVVEGKESLIKIYAPKGTRGLNGNGHMYGVNDDKHHIGIGVEHEFTLGAGQEYIVVDRNNKTDPPVVEILLI